VWHVGLQHSVLTDAGRTAYSWTNKKMRTITVLLVDDYEPFRRLTCSMLQETPGIEIIGQASDGFEAVQKTEELRPDLILLDIGLPKMSGIHAARQIAKAVPDCKIIFLSQETSADVVEEGRRVGALAYVAKIDAGKDLLKAIEAAHRGAYLLSSSIAPVIAALK
jgi:DNA-binding NarL/FixJ family response regulator